MVTTAEAYGRFLAMIAAKGSFRGRRVLSPEAMEEMERLQAGACRSSWRLGALEL